ncbi:MepB family protein [Myroides odoratus]|uniref:MepB family protein n=1 Tax=Myroides odoratus TaxID=256 RepID=UPI0039B102CF
MQAELKQIETRLHQHLGLQLSTGTQDKECADYLGYNYQVDQLAIKFRKAKITPKKAGQFVTLWKRNAQQITVPFDITDPFDFYFIVVANQEQWGCFIFPRQLLGDKHILTTAGKEGKRGFRVYPQWDIPTSKQALQTKAWQGDYFISLSSKMDCAIEKATHILQNTMAHP